LSRCLCAPWSVRSSPEAVLSLEQFFVFRFVSVTQPQFSSDSCSSLSFSPALCLEFLIRVPAPGLVQWSTASVIEFVFHTVCCAHLQFWIFVLLLFFDPAPPISGQSHKPGAGFSAVVLPFMLNYFSCELQCSDLVSSYS
jgi:hypothetical protein